MIDVYSYEYAGFVELVDISGNSYMGEAMDVTDAEDQGDEGRECPSLTIDVSGSLIDFYADEIISIEKIQK